MDKACCEATRKRIRGPVRPVSTQSVIIFMNGVITLYTVNPPVDTFFYLLFFFQGALWHIFPAHSADKMRQFLKRVSYQPLFLFLTPVFDRKQLKGSALKAFNQRTMYEREYAFL